MSEVQNKLHLVLGLSALLWVPAAWSQEVRLRPQATAASADVRLVDVAELHGISEAAAKVAVVQLAGQGSSADVNIFQVQVALRRAGFNTVPMSFSGAGRCSVKWAATQAAVAQAAVAAASAAAPAVAETPDRPATEEAKGSASPAASTAPADVKVKKAPAAAPMGANTIAGRIIEQVVEQAGADPADVKIVFAPSSAETVSWVAEGKISITSTDRNLLGRRCWRAEFQKDGRLCQRYITATVQLTRAAVITRRAIAVGTTVSAADVELVLREDDGRQSRMTSLESVVGQQVRRQMEAGKVIAAEDLKSPLLVMRGQLAWVQAGPVRVRARAMADGTAGQTVEFENLQSKGRFSARVTEVGEAQIVLAPQQ